MGKTIMFVIDKEAPLLYHPDKIISVRSSDLKTEYIPGKDYLVKDGKILLTEKSAIPFTSEGEYYPAEYTEGECFGSIVEGHPWIKFGEEDTFFSKQVHVTYTHSGNWNGYIPEKSGKFKRFEEKVKNGEEVTVLFFGDSITTGVNSSKTINVEPYAESWPEMVVNSMKKHYGNYRINYVNTAVGGTTVQWGIDSLKERAIDIHPDLLVLGFGMNDGGLTAEEFGKRTKLFLTEFTSACPETDIAVIATMLPHFRVAGFRPNQYWFEEGLNRLCAQYDHIDVIPMKTMHSVLLEKKRYFDMTGNNVNHPNDFLARLYAQTINRIIMGI